jgi:hypothetical protein
VLILLTLRSFPQRYVTTPPIVRTNTCTAPSTDTASARRFAVTTELANLTVTVVGYVSDRSRLLFAIFNAAFSHRTAFPNGDYA